jgi:hypothetical protein
MLALLPKTERLQLSGAAGSRASSPIPLVRSAGAQHTDTVHCCSTPDDVAAVVLLVQPSHARRACSCGECSAYPYPLLCVAMYHHYEQHCQSCTIDSKVTGTYT